MSSKCSFNQRVELAECFCLLILFLTKSPLSKKVW
ncbi:Uncharacterised protein [Vibrio cholerae]|nr:Uncharacterised protein [Vibrio cholerae]